MSARDRRAVIDPVTLAAVALLSYSSGSLIHEALGHGGTCLISGGRPLLITTVEMECSLNGRFVLAGGTLMNGLAALLFMVAQRIAPRRYCHLRFFCWLAMTVNLLAAAGYLLFSGIGGFGDWAAFISGFQPQWLFRAGLAILGAIGYMLAVWFSLRMMLPFIGNDPRQRVSQAARLTYIPYFTGAILACLAASLNPAGWRLILLSAAASTFGGSSALLWMHLWLKDTHTFPPAAESEPLAIPRNWALIVAALCAALVFVFVFGPGVPRHAKWAFET